MANAPRTAGRRPVTVRLQSPTYDEVAAAATDEGRTVSAMAERLILDGLNLRQRHDAARRISEAFDSPLPAQH